MDKIVVLVGPTAVGKTEYSIELAKAFDGEIVSMDSMQLYKYLDIGSAKPTKEEMDGVPHHLIDEIDPRNEFSVAIYRDLAIKAIKDVLSRGRMPVLTGGTGLYLNSIIYDMDFGADGKDDEFRASMEAFLQENGPEALHDRLRKVDPESAERIHPNNTHRVIRALEAAEVHGEPLKDFNEVVKMNDDFDPILICLERDREELYDRINRRVDILIEQGLIEEVKNLINMGFTVDDIAMKGIGYKELIEHFNGAYDLDEAIRLIKRNTRHYAKRQLTWFKRYDQMKWFNISEYDDRDKLIGDLISWVEKNR